MRILFTGFTPFGGETVNPAWKAVSKLPSFYDDIEIFTLEIPTEFKKGFEAIENFLKDNPVDAVVCVGQAGGRAKISVEKVALNYMDGNIPDNGGYMPRNTPIKEDGWDGYFSTIPVEDIVDYLKECNIPANVSLTAGSYVCNDTLYRLLYYIKKEHLPVKAGFIHVPYAPEQVLEKISSAPSMELATMTKALIEIAVCISKKSVDEVR